MKEFLAHELAYCYGFLARIMALADEKSKSDPLGQPDTATMRSVLKDTKAKCEQLGLPITSSHADRAIRRLDRPITYAEASEEADEVRTQLHQELKRTAYLQIAEADVVLYAGKEFFGAEVLSKIGDPGGDIEEAAKCMAVDRPTAAIFHLMRVMERGVQALGTHLGYALAGEKEWQKILNRVNIKVATLPEDTPEQKRHKEKMAEIAAHLYHVKVAWRNPVMHPRESYTGEQAREIFNDIDRFMRDLATVL